MKNNRLDADIDKYLSEIRKSLGCSSAKKKIIRELKSNIEEYRIANPDPVFDDILSHFGTPEDISDSYLSTLNDDELKDRLHGTRWIVRIAMLVGAIIIVAFAIVMASIIIYNKQKADRNLEIDASKLASISCFLK